MNNNSTKSKNKANGNPYVGVYGVYIKDGKALLIKKARGPYTGMYDLPGGGIEEGEANDQTLVREFVEEVGVQLESYDFLYDDKYQCKYIGSTGIEKDFKHQGSFYSVTIPDDANIKTTPDGQDSLGAEYIEIDRIQGGTVTVAPMAKRVILTLINKE